MPVIQKLLDMDQMFHTLPVDPIIINDLVNNSEENQELISELISSKYTSDMVSLLPSCRCGDIKGEVSLNVKCPKCNTYVKSQIEDSVQPTVWLRKPDGVSKIISPIVYIMLKNRFKKSGFQIIRWITDSTFKSNVKQPPVLNKLVEMGIQRGYNNFVEHFDTIMDILFNMKDFKLKNATDIDYLRILITKYRHRIFSDYLPLPNKALLIVEKTNVGVYVDPIIVEAVDAIQMLASIDMNFHDQSPRVKENRTIKALDKLCDFYESFFSSNLSPKSGQFRKHVYGSRTNFSFRGVISSLTDTHSYNEIHVPWGVGMTAFRHHLVNKLIKQGMDLNSAIGYLLAHVERYDPRLDKMLQEIIDSSPDKGIVCICQRNPSLLQGSAIRTKITKFKKDPKDTTISISILIVKPLKADLV